MEQFIKQRPTPTDKYLGNPHKGCCTFQHFNGDKLFPDTFWSEEGPTEFPAPEKTLSGSSPQAQWYNKHVNGYLPTTVAYCRWFWELLEPKEGKYDFSIIEKAMETAEKRGQTLAVRLMAFGAQTQPQVPEWYRKKYSCEVKTYKSAKQVAPVHDSDDYFEKWGACVKAFAEKYDSDPRLETIDITYIGPWGEGAGECSQKQCAKFAALWETSFNHTPRLSLLGEVQLEENIKCESGWRCDCFGDLKEPGSPDVLKHLSWNHMYDSYPMQICGAQAQNSWQTAPVHFESCWVPMHWYREGYDIDFIIEQGLKFHGTYFMPKYTRLPDEWMDKLAKFCRKLGYRYIYRQSQIDSSITAGKTMHFDSWIENVGVAPIYKKYDFALRFRQNDHEETVVLDDIDICKWLPGDVWLDKEINIPEWLKPGICDISAALLGADKTPKIKFAVKEQYSDFWLPLGTPLVNSE